MNVFKSKSNCLLKLNDLVVLHTNVGTKLCFVLEVRILRNKIVVAGWHRRILWKKKRCLRVRGEELVKLWTHSAPVLPRFCRSTTKVSNFKFAR